MRKDKIIVVTWANLHHFLTVSLQILKQLLALSEPDDARVCFRSLRMTAASGISRKPPNASGGCAVILVSIPYHFSVLKKC